MKANKTVKMLMSLVLCFAMVLSTMALPAMAASVGDTVDVDAEFGALVKNIPAPATFGSGTSEGNYYTNYHITASTTTDTTHGSVAVMKKGVADTEAGTNRGSVFAAIKNSVKWTDTAAFSDEFIFDMYFKVPVSENVITYLFNASNSPWGAAESNYSSFRAALKNGIQIKNGYIYLANDTTNAINATQLTADTWYRIVLQVKGGANRVLNEKVLILDASNAIVAQVSDWTQIGGNNVVGSSSLFAAFEFATDYPTDYTGTEAAVSAMNIYKNPTSLTASAMLEGSNRVLQYDASGTDVDSAPVAERITGHNFNMERQNAFVTFRLPEGEGTLKLFRWNDATGKKAGVGGTYKDSFAVTIENGKVYANVYNSASILNDASATAKATSYTKLVETSTGSGVYYTKTDMGTTLEANKWYTIEIQRTNMFDNTKANILNIYEGKVTYNGNGTVTGNLIKTWGNETTELFYLPYVDSTQVVQTNNNTGATYPYTTNRTITFFAGYGYQNPIYIHAFNIDAWQTLTETSITNNKFAYYGIDNNWTHGWYHNTTSGTVHTKYGKVINIGDDFTDFRAYNLNTTSGNSVYDLPVPVGAKVTYDPDFLGTGVTYSRTIPTIKVLFDADVAFDNSIITLKDALGNAVNFTATYDAATKTATLTDFDQLEYDGVYTLTIGAAKTDAFGFDTTATSYTFTCVDSFTVSNAKILDSADADVTTSPANGAVINGSVTLQNMSDSQRPYLVILALYKGTMMKDVVSTSGNITAGTTLTDVETPTITVDEAGCSAKVMVWESWTNIMPKAGAYEVGVTQ